MTETFDGNWKKSTEILHKSKSDRYLCRLQCWKKMFTMHRALLQHNYSRSFPLSFTSASPCSQITQHNILALIPRFPLKSTGVDSLDLTISQRINNFLHEYHVLYVLWFGGETCIKHRGRSNNLNLDKHILPPSAIHSSVRFTNWIAIQVTLPQPGQILCAQLQSRTFSNIV